MEQNKNKKDIIVKIILKEIKKGKQKFTIYSGVTALGNWFDLTFGAKVVKPTKTTAFIIKADNWFTAWKKNQETGEYILNKSGQRIKKLVLMQLDEELTPDDERYPESFKYSGDLEV